MEVSSMKRALLSVSLFALCFFAGQVLLSFGRADDAKAKKDSQKKSKDDDKSKDQKPESVKRAQTTVYAEVNGKISKVDDTILCLNGVLGRRATLEDIIIAEDVKVRMPAEREFDSKGKPLNITGIYSPQIGQVVSEVEGLSPAYQITGEELYALNVPSVNSSFRGIMPGVGEDGTDAELEGATWTVASKPLARKTPGACCSSCFPKA